MAIRAKHYCVLWGDLTALGASEQKTQQRRTSSVPQEPGTGLPPGGVTAQNDISLMRNQPSGGWPTSGD